MSAVSQHNADGIRLSVIPHPFSVERVNATVPAGLSLQQMIACIQPDSFLQSAAHIYINGDYIQKEMWSSVYPKPNAIISIRMVPMGGGGSKNPLRTVLTLAVMAAVPVIGTAIGNMSVFAGLGTGFKTVIGAGVNMLGRLAINAIAPPGKGKFKSSPDSPTLFIQGARNDVRPFGRISRVLGKHRMVPPMGARAYTETVGNEQYVRMLFIWGYGPLEISDLRIGETPLSEFEGVQIENRKGYADDEPVSLYANSVLQNDLNIKLDYNEPQLRATENDTDEISVDITFPRGLVEYTANGQKRKLTVRIEVQYSPAGENNWTAPATDYKNISEQETPVLPRPYTRSFRGITYQTKRIDRIVMDAASGKIKVIEGEKYHIGLSRGDIFIPAVPDGYIAIARVERVSDKVSIDASQIIDERDPALFGKLLESENDFEPQVSTHNDKIKIAAGGLRFNGFEITAAQGSALRRSLRFSVPRGQYDVRLKRISWPGVEDDNRFSDVIWTALRSIRSEHPVQQKGLAMTALRIKATDQLNGVLDRFNGIVESVLPDWDGENWVPQETSNPASLFRHILQGSENARPLADSRIDLQKIEYWHAFCDEKGYEYNGVIDYDISVRELLGDVASTGRASTTVIDGKWSVVVDEPSAVPVQHFTPRNSFGFSGEKMFDDLPHALRVRFINRDRGWQQDERLVFDDGYNADTATTYEVLDLPGITSADQAWKAGRYHIATARLRPEKFSFYADLEHLVCTRGDLIRFTHDVPLFGLMTARVVNVLYDDENPETVTGVTLDAAVDMDVSKTYAARFRLAQGATLLANIVTAAGQQTTLSFDQPLSGSLLPNSGDLCMVGERGQESVELVVSAVEPQGDLKAKVVCVAAAPAIHTADQGEIPAFDSHITVPNALKRPPRPVLSKIQSGAESIIRHADGSVTSRIILTLSPPDFDRPYRTEILMRALGETGYSIADTFMISRHVVSLTNIDEGETYDLQFRYIADNGLSSPALHITNHRVEGSLAEPQDVEDFSVTILGNTAHLSWQVSPDVDISHYEIRFSPDVETAQWSTASLLIERVPYNASSVSVVAGAGTYFIKAVDVGGRKSKTAALSYSTIANVESYQPVISVEEHPHFIGGGVNISVIDGALQLVSVAPMDDWENIDDIASMEYGTEGLAGTGLALFANKMDLGAVYTAKLTTHIVAQGIDVSTTTDLYPDIDDIEDWDQSADPSQWEVQLYVSLTNDDPNDPYAEWSGYYPFVLGDYTARGFDFRLHLRGHSRSITPAVYELGVSAAMAERLESGKRVSSDTTVTSVAFDYPFYDVPSVHITAQDMGTGDYYSLTNITETGFDIRFYDTAGNGVARNFDYLVKGYGKGQ